MPASSIRRQFEAKRRALITEIETAQTARRSAAETLAAGETTLAEADRAARAAHDALSCAREAAARAEERHEGVKRRLADLAAEIREILETEPETLTGLAGFEADAPLPDIADIEAELDKLKRDRERLGAVNLRADEELREVETQHTTLVTERDDLVEAIKRLRQGIQSLNREARERLQASFSMVNSHFQRLFTELFGGGTAELQPVENDDPLEAGLEILAKPPGKKPATLSLLSGGEQALTALALIFAVFLTNPAPICVLDEVDARSTTTMSTASATCWTKCRSRPTRASSSSPTTPSPWRAWTGCSASPWRSAACRSSSPSISNAPCRFATRRHSGGGPRRLGTNGISSTCLAEPDESTIWPLALHHFCLDTTPHVVDSGARFGRDPPVASNRVLRVITGSTRQFGCDHFERASFGERVRRG
jgi:hypothetical protein